LNRQPRIDSGAFGGGHFLLAPNSAAGFVAMRLPFFYLVVLILQLISFVSFEVFKHTIGRYDEPRTVERTVTVRTPPDTISIELYNRSAGHHIALEYLRSIRVVTAYVLTDGFGVDLLMFNRNKIAESNQVAIHPLPVTNSFPSK
jgi:hypothetical protein